MQAIQSYTVAQASYDSAVEHASKQQFSGPSATSFGEPRFWMMVSDLTIVASSVVAVILTIMACVEWGLGLHARILSKAQIEMTLQMFYLYQIFYKFGVGLSKVANLSTPIWLFDSKHEKIQQVLQNIDSSVVVVALPWWLFSFVTYKRKYIIAMIMTLLALSELILGCVRLKGLYTSSQSLNDAPYGVTTGIFGLSIGSQLWHNFSLHSHCLEDHRRKHKARLWI
ncbi:hypothetical protein DID88_000756 [Monilinia fructigena]|uniref:Rhodopsin domain-containing protein n=1 Tax=Monilinia fructigena TaxID=38457 RepID=A0A395IIV5_9HELO|nr:hypothetical protein DID88_000756 [Monilinia fructigena]